jgi:hypothetical protein
VVAYPLYLAVAFAYFLRARPSLPHLEPRLVPEEVTAG